MAGIKRKLEDEMPPSIEEALILLEKLRREIAELEAIIEKLQEQWFSERQVEPYAPSWFIGSELTDRETEPMIYFPASNGWMA